MWRKNQGLKKSLKKPPKPRAGGLWSEARFWSFVRSNLRRARWPVIYQAKKLAERKYKGPNKRQQFEYQCAICKEWHMGKDVQVDHIIPCGSLNRYEDLPEFVRKLYCEVDNLRILCKDCHLIVTYGEKHDSGSSCDKQPPESGGNRRRKSSEDFRQKAPPAPKGMLGRAKGQRGR
jgi:hypothetical protein